MAYPPSSFKTWTSGEILTASDLNNAFTTVNNSNQTEDIDDYSTNATEMRVTTDPYPSAAESLPTALAGEIERLRYIIKQITGKSQWYVDAAAIGSKGADVASAAALAVLTDGNFFDVTGTTTVTSINTLGVGSVINLQFDSTVKLTHHSSDLILPDSKDIYTKAGDVATFVEYASGDWHCINYSRSRAEQLAAYRRPNLVHVSATTVDVENNTGTAHQTIVLFPDGDVRSVTEDTSSTHVNRRAIITATASQSGTKDSGIRTSETEANNTWYATYACKVTDNNTDFVLIFTTVLPTRANFATLNTNFGTNNWVYLGLIRNGDNQSAAGDILYFKQSGNLVTLENTVDGSATDIGDAVNGIEYVATTTGTALSYTYSAGTGATGIPDNISHCRWLIEHGNVVTNMRIRDAGASRTYFMLATNGRALIVTPFIAAAEGIRVTASSAAAETIFLTGFIDNVLGVSGNSQL